MFSDWLGGGKGSLEIGPVPSPVLTFIKYRQDQSCSVHSQGGAAYFLPN